MPLSIALILFAAPCAAGAVWIFRRSSNQAEIRAARNRILAHLMEFRLYGGEPGVIWKSQKALLRENARYLRLMLRPVLLTAFPAMLVVFAVDQWYGRTSLQPGADSVLTIQIRGPFKAGSIMPIVEMPSGIVADTAPVRICGLRQVSWRIRPSRETSGLIRIVLPGEVITRRIDVGGSRIPLELPVRSRAVEWARIQYPPASIAMFGLEFSPSGYFTIAWLLLTALFGLSFRVAF